MTRALLIAAAIAVLAACASTPTYGPAATQGGAGYSETRIETDRYFVTFRSNSAADESLMHDFALRRAADIALENGREWFWVDRRTFDGRTYNDGTRVGFGVGGGSWSGNTSIGSSVGFSIPLGGGGSGVRAATLEIRLGEGPKPDDPDAYDARAVATNLRAGQTP